MVINTLGNGEKGKEKEEECRNGKMVEYMKVIGKTTRLKVMDDCYILMEIFILESGWMIRLMVKALMFIMMALFMKENGS